MKQHLPLIVLLGIICFQFKNTYTSNNTLVTDSGKIYQTQVAQVLFPTSSEEIQKVISHAYNNNQTISIAGSKHSQGGQSNALNSIQINTQNFNELIDLNVKNKTVTVQSGMTWELLQIIIQPHALSITVMQSANVFSIGGSASANIHGRDPHYGTMIDSIISCKIIDSSGDIKTISREENKELFSLIIGGYGLFGFIAEITLKLTDNVMCQRENKLLNYKNYASYFQNNIANNQNVELHYGRFNITPDKNFAKELLSISYIKEPHEINIKTIPKESSWSQFIGHYVFDLYRIFCGVITNKIRWFVLNYLPTFPEKSGLNSRNRIMSHYIRAATNPHSNSTDLLQEYFIPINNFENFMQSFQKITLSHNIKMLNTTARIVPKCTESFLSYAQQDCIALVLYFTTKLDNQSINNIKSYTHQLTESCLSNNGTFYLTYQQFATKKQLLKAYPKLPEFIEKKKKYDSKGVFMNEWYKNYISKLLTLS